MVGKKISERKSGQLAFEDFYRQIYGERWDDLRGACLVKRTHYFDIAQTLTGEKYAVDPASHYAASQLHINPGDQVLDLCSAPGGKALGLLSQEAAAQAHFTLNERSPARFQRLKANIKLFAPQVYPQVSFTRYDGKKWCLHQQEVFDKILLDAPCSSERHLLHAPAHMQVWSPKRSKKLAQEQFALLSSAWLLLRPGGQLLYSTCALAPQENDGVVAKLLERKKDALLVEKKSPPEYGEKTLVGSQIFPDRAQGDGPIYWSLLVKSSPDLI